MRCLIQSERVYTLVLVSFQTYSFVRISGHIQGKWDDETDGFLMYIIFDGYILIDVYLLEEGFSNWEDGFTGLRVMSRLWIQPLHVVILDP